MMQQLNENNNVRKPPCDSISLSAFTQLQTYGALLVVDRLSLKIIHYSENVEDILNTPVAVIKNNNITDFLTFLDPNGEVETWLRLCDKHSGQFIWREGDSDHSQTILVYAHHQNDLIILEIELMDHKQLNEQVFSLFKDIVNLNLDDSAQDTAIIAKIMCETIQRITGYDRVLLYQFNEDNSGVVLGEALKNSMDSYLGYHFPDTDIPYHVREMYLEQPLRYIPNIDYTPISLLPSLSSGENQAVDLTNVMLRAVSPIHIEYLRNMGVSSTISVAIIYNNKLWGLIVCHHKSAKHLSMYYRFGLVWLAKLIIRQLVTIDMNKCYIAQNRISQNLAKIKDMIYNATNVPILFENITNDALNMLSADGIVFFYHNKVLGVGSIPNDKQISELIEWLLAKHPSQPFITHHLSGEYPAAQEYSEIAAGLLALPLTQNDKNYLLIFRKEVVSAIIWAGDPTNVLTRTEDRYSPRNSFQMWKDLVKNQSAKWMPLEVEAAISLQSSILSRLLQFLIKEREEEQKRFDMMQEMQVKLESEVNKRTDELNKSNAHLRDAIMELHEIKDYVLKKENMATIGQLAAGMAHEINNPLAFIISNIDFLLNQSKKSTPIKDVDIILSESKEGLMRIKHIVSNLLIFSDRNVSNSEGVDINIALKSAIELTRSAWSLHAKIIENFTDVPTISTSLNQLKLLFINFILNAAQSIAADGEIKISTSLSDTSILITFADNGCGIPAQNMSKLFTPFFTTKPKSQSLGLGLAMNYGIVEALGGKITVESKVGRGSTFTVHLPRENRT